LIIPLFIILTIILFYQLLYKSPRVDKGVVKLAIIFKEHTSIVTAVRFTHNDSLVVTSSVDSTIKIWRRETGEVVQTIKQPQGVSYLDVSNDGNYIVTGSYDEKVRLWRISDGKLVREFTGHKGTIWTVAFSPDGKLIASSGDDKIIRLWSTATGDLIHTLNSHELIVWSVRFSPDGTKLASCSFDRSFKLWNVKDGKLLMNNKEHQEAIVDIAFSHDGRLLDTTSDDETIKLWKVNDGALIRTMKVPEHIQAVAFSPNDKLLMTGGRDKPTLGEFVQSLFGDSEFNKGVSARLWEISTGTLLHTFTKHSNDVNDVAVSNDGNWIATASADHTVHLWKLN
jgi:WD40 repeat protein